MKLVTGTFLALMLASGAVFAQATPPKAPAADAADVKFKAVDKNNNGSLEGAELDAYKADLTKIDTDKDGKISSAEFAAATRSGVIK
jgi:EF hand